LPEAVQRQLLDLLNAIIEKQIDPAAVMGKLDEIAKGVDGLKQKSLDSARGVISIYDFNGARRVQSAGRISVTVGPEIDRFRQMVQLHDAAKWAELVTLCEREITSTPEWLTPYLYAGVAYANLGDRQKAIAKLSHVVEQAGRDPAYQDAERLLRALGQ
jgi:hypothetical protein